MVGLDCAVSNLQDDLTQVLQSVNSLIGIDQSQCVVKADVFGSRNDSQSHFYTVDGQELFMSQDGISIIFPSDNFSYRKLGDFLSEAFPMLKELRATNNELAVESQTIKIRVTTPPFMIFVPLYDVYPTLPSIKAPKLLVTPNDSNAMQQLLDIFLTCYVGYQIPKKAEFRADFFAGRVKPFIANAILAWACKHAAVFHGMFEGQDANQVGEAHYQLARTQLTDHLFENDDVDAVFGLLLLYGYQVGKASAALSCTNLPVSYLQLGLATQIARKLKMYQPHPELSLEMQESYRRLWSLIYFLDALTVGQTDRPSMIVDDKEITVLPQSPMSHESLDSAARVQYAKCRTMIRRLYRNIANCLHGSEVELSIIHKVNAEIDELQRYIDNDLHLIGIDKFPEVRFSKEGYCKLSIDVALLKIQLFFSTIPTFDHSPDELNAREICFNAAVKIMDLVSIDAASGSLWCLYSVESSWAASTVLKWFLSNGSDDEKQIGLKHLHILRHLMETSTVKGHWPVMKLVDYIDV
ncbi:hypothetical protein INT43_006712 [Umbelopsis isabellina]|uniref:Xylanolytic transcriptional activator regulatory domain-containing protein n=1 Tax=Mortierella isabellina TaxID=91625 RepID=A0A8H7Q0S7_MORIS|nr:hypothetical protein INT43_006712 [Umbelopsis isabellina]